MPIGRDLQQFRTRRGISLGEQLSEAMLEHSRTLDQAHLQLADVRDSSASRRSAAQQQREASADLLQTQAALIELGERLESLSQALHRQVEQTS